METEHHCLGQPTKLSTKVILAAAWTRANSDWLEAVSCHHWPEIELISALKRCQPVM
jgi:hypothetical protein